MLLDAVWRRMEAVCGAHPDMERLLSNGIFGFAYILIFKRPGYRRLRRCISLTFVD